jgi:hypothetical protein
MSCCCRSIHILFILWYGWVIQLLLGSN